MRQSNCRRVVAALAAVSLLVSPLSALAQSPSGPTSASPASAPATSGASPSSAGATATAPTVGPTTAALEEARTRYQRALDLYNDKNYEAARIEFQRAYQLAPSYKILYNIGVCDAARNDYVAASTSLEAYLAQGKDEIPPDRRTEVTALLNDLRPRIGHLTITSSVPGAAVSVDDVPVGVTPLPGPIAVNPGRRRVSVSKYGWFPQTKSVVVAGSERPQVEVNLVHVPVAQNTNLLPYAMLGGTALLAIGAGVTGYFAIKASNDQKNDLNTLGISETQLESNRTKMRDLAVVADSLTGAAVAVGGIALYLMLTNTHKEAPVTTQVGIGLGSLALRGSF